MKETALIISATSSLAKEVAHQLAREGVNLILLARDASELHKTAQDIRIRWGVSVREEVYEAQKMSQVKVRERGFGIFCFQGYMSDDDSLTISDSERRNIADINYVSVTSILENLLKTCSPSYLCVVTSVAGERGKARNLHYNAAKAALSVYLEGLRQSLDIPVTDIKLGFVDTPMTSGMKSRLIASRSAAARAIVRSRKKNRSVYVPWFWRWIFFVIKLVPSCIWKSLKL